MTSIDAGKPMPDLVEDRGNYLTHTKGFLSWALTLDHKRIGMMYLISVLLSFFVAGIFAILVRIELMNPGEAFLSQDR